MTYRRDIQVTHRLTCGPDKRFRAEVCPVPRTDRPGTGTIIVRRIGASDGTIPVPIGPPVWALRAKMVGHTDRQIDGQTNTFGPTFFIDPPMRTSRC